VVVVWINIAWCIADSVVSILLSLTLSIISTNPQFNTGIFNFLYVFLVLCLCNRSWDSECK